MEEEEEEEEQDVGESVGDEFCCSSVFVGESEVR